MKTRISIILFFALGILIASCTKENVSVSPDSNITMETRAVSDFNKLEIIGPFEVYVTISNTAESVRIQANENLQSHIKTSKSGSKLVVEFKDDLSISGSATLKVHITMTDPVDIVGMGAVVIHLGNELTTTDLNVRLDGASTLIGFLNVENFTVNLTGASVLDLRGHADNFELTGIGASYIQGYDFDIDYLDATLAGASVLMLTINTQIDIVASGASFIYYKGTAQINSINLSGASQINKVD